MYHGEEYIQEAVNRYKTVASGGIPENIEEYTISNKEIEDKILLTDLLLKSGLFSSKSEGRRMIEQNGISINNEKVTDVNKVITKEDFNDDYLIIQKGKKTFKKIVISD